MRNAWPVGLAGRPVAGRAVAGLISLCGACYNAAVEPLSDINLAELKMVKYPAPVLRHRCPEVEGFDDQLQALAQRMFQIMYANRGVGLAAPQVGLSVRIFVFNPAAEPGQAEGVCLNPQIVDGQGEVQEEEGCLSVPGVTARIKRFKRVTVRGVDLQGRPIELAGEDLTSRILQHEVDHLNGMLIIDRMSAVGRLANRRTLKELEADYAEGKSD